MTGPPTTRLRNLAPALTHYTHPKLMGVAAYLMGRAGARRVRFVESAWATAGPLEDVMAASGWDVRSLRSAANVEFENTNALGAMANSSPPFIENGGRETEILHRCTRRKPL